MVFQLFKEFNKSDWYRHVIVWGFVTLHFAFLTSFTGNLVSKVVWVVTLLMNFSFSFYTLLFFIWPGIFEKRKYYFLSLLILLFVLFVFIYYIQTQFLIPKLGGRLFITGNPLGSMIGKFLMNFSFILFPSLGTYYNKKGIRDIKKSLSEEQGILERELSFLKNQFYTHLTFNFFNFCYNRVRCFSPDTANSIEDFSELLRYSLKYNPKEIVLLNEEIEYIRNYLSFQKFATDIIYVNFEVTGETKKVRIIPRFLIFFIEYAFENSIINKPDDPVNISITVNDNEINLSIISIRNDKESINPSEKLISAMNVLNLFYKDRHRLNINHNDPVFSFELSLISDYYN